MTDYLKKIILPLLLGTVLVSMTLYIYNDSLIIPLTLASFFIQAVLFVVLGFLRKRRILGTLIYIVMCFVVLYVVMSLWFMSFRGNGPMSFSQWFYGAQDASTFFLPYTLMILIGFSFLFASSIFYFTQVIYRCVMVLLCSLIPFAIYAKRYENPSGIYIALVLILFLTLMIHYRQTAEPSVKIFSDKSYWLSVGIFVSVIILITMLIPKYEVTPLRQKFDDMVEAMEGDVTVGKNNAGFISDVSAGSGFDDDTTGEIFYYVSAKEPLYLKIQTYDNYLGERKWSVDRAYDTYYPNWEKEYSFYNPQYLINAAAEYENSKPQEQKSIIKIYNIGDNLREADIIPNNYAFEYLFSANTTYDIKDVDGLDKKTYLSGTGGLLVDTDYLQTDKYKILYYSEKISRAKGAEDFALQFEDMDAFIDYCQEIATCKNISEQSRYTAETFIECAEDAVDYYDSTYALASDRMHELAVEITSDCNSDYEKAVAIQNYFLTGDYSYDLNFKTNDKSIENFVFNDKCGICADYATAMTILAREVGLPARYTVGFNMSEEMSENFYAVRDNDAHAFTEVYISGYGWMTFDATPASLEDTDVQDNRTATDTTRNVVVTATIIFAVAVAGALVIIMLPAISEGAFRIRFSFSRGKSAVILIYKHTGKILEKKVKFRSNAYSSEELRKKAFEDYGADITNICILTDNVLYGGRAVNAKQLSEAYRCYKLLYKAVREKKKTK